MNYSHASSSSFLPHHSLLSQPLASNHCTTNSAETTNISSAASRPLCGAADTLSITDTNKPSLCTVIGLTTSRKSDSGETLHLNTLCHTDVLPPQSTPHLPFKAYSVSFMQSRSTLLCTCYFFKCSSGKRGSYRFTQMMSTFICIISMSQVLFLKPRPKLLLQDLPTLNRFDIVSGHC